MKNREKRKDGTHMGFGFGFDLMGRLFPLLFLIVFVFVISTIVGTFVSKAKRERKNDHDMCIITDIQRYGTEGHIF